MKDYPCRKDVTYGLAFSGHVSDVNNLRGDESWCSASNKKIFFLISMSSESKIAEGKVTAFLFSKHNVFWFEISVYDSKFRQITEGSEDVLYNFLDLIWFHFFIVLNRELLTFKT